MRSTALVYKDDNSYVYRRFQHLRSHPYVKGGSVLYALSTQKFYVRVEAVTTVNQASGCCARLK
jgi:hypothetical protein